MASYCVVDDEARSHLGRLIRWLHDEVVSAGGDGDSVWYSELYDVNDLLPLVREYNAGLSRPWEIRLENGTIHWSIGQEWLVITNDKAYFDSIPDWVQAKLRY